tara:strand:- start:2150 stop:3271 length:1122 start_codon:yes stop_codon:yes gene_type:complete
MSETEVGSTITPGDDDVGSADEEPQTLEATLRAGFSERLTELETEYRFSDQGYEFANKEGVVDDYFTSVIPFHDKREKAVRQYGGFLADVLKAGSTMEEVPATVPSPTGEEVAGTIEQLTLTEEGKELTGLFFQNFPVVQVHLPIGQSKRWAKEGLAAFNEYKDAVDAVAREVEKTGSAPEDWDQPAAYQKVKDMFGIDRKRLAGMYDSHRFNMAGLKAIAAGAALISTLAVGGMMASQSSKIGNLRGANNTLQGTVGSLNSQVNALNGTYNAVRNAIDRSDVDTLKREVCDYLGTNPGNLILQHSENPALGQLFDGVVGGSEGRDSSTYTVYRNLFVNIMDPILEVGTKPGYVRFKNTGCLKGLSTMRGGRK